MTLDQQAIVFRLQDEKGASRTGRFRDGISPCLVAVTMVVRRVRSIQQSSDPWMGHDIGLLNRVPLVTDILQPRES